MRNVARRIRRIWRHLDDRLHGLTPPWRRREREIADEIEAHLQMAARDRIDRGESPDDARAAALREFGNVALVARTTREVWSWPRLEQCWQDLRFGARILRQAPALSLTAILLIALVVGGNTTIYTIVHGVLTSPARGVTAERLVTIQHVEPERALADPYVSYPNFLDYRRLAQTTSSLAGWSDARMTIAADAGTYAVWGALVTSNYFDLFGVAAQLGRPLRADDDALRHGLTAVISERVWREHFGAAADVVGRRIAVNQHPATIVGVAAPQFAGMNMTPGEDVWLPLEGYYRAIGQTDVLGSRRQPLVLMAGPLAPGATRAEARAEFEAVAAQLRTAYPADNKEHHARVSPYSSTALLPVTLMAPYFLALFAVVTIVTLLVVSANVANLMLGRAVTRQRDAAVRQSLGASRLRLVRMLFAEGITLAAAASVVACLLAWWTSRAVVRVVEPRPGLAPELRMDWAVAGYALALTLLATIAFSVAPALRTWHQSVLPLLRSGEQAVAPGRSRLSSALIVMQLACSVLLLTSAGLAWRSVSLLDGRDVGFASDHLLLVTVRAGRTDTFITRAPGGVEREESFTVLERVRERLTAVPNVEAVSYAGRVPGAVLLGTQRLYRGNDREWTGGYVRPVGPGFLQTLGLEMLAGREVTAADRRGATRTAVINQPLAEALWPGRSPLGQTLLLGDAREPVEIVGVAPNALVDGPSRDPRPRYVFVAEQQQRGNPPIDPTFYVRYRGSLEAVAPAVAKTIAAVDPDLPIVTMSTMTARLDAVTGIEQIVTTFLVLFALPSLLIAALGQYAVTMFNMRRRTRDFGVRLALGASPGQIQRAVLREALRATALGLAIGVALSVGAGVAAQSVLIGVTPTDPITYGGVFALLAAASLLASSLPAWRAGRVDVMHALRQE